MNFATEKLYLKNAYMSDCLAKVTQVSESGIVTDRTVAFPLGGGQEGDAGTLELIEDGAPATIVNFIDTQKGPGRAIYLENFPVIQVENSIFHVVAPESLHLFKVGMQLNIKIDLEKRAKLTISHSGLHLALMCVEKLRPKVMQSIVGCHITPEYARVDISTADKFCQEELETISNHANELINRDEKINVFPHPKEAEAWYWQCLDQIIPCGGTHLTSTKYIGAISLKRKNLGKNMERITATFINPQLCLEKYCKEINCGHTK